MKDDLIIFALSIVELDEENETPNCDDPGHECNSFDPPCQQSQTKQINGKYV